MNGNIVMNISSSTGVSNNVLTNVNSNVVGNLKVETPQVLKDSNDTFVSTDSTLDTGLGNQDNGGKKGIKKILKLVCNLFSNTTDVSKMDKGERKHPLKEVDDLVVSSVTGKATRLPTLVELEKLGVSTELPEYLYHMTSKKNYESMLASGKLEQGFDHYCGQAVFAFDADNFKKNWNNILDSNVCMKEKLLKQAAKFGDEVVLLKIPTKILNKDKLFVRSENVVFDKLSANIYDKRDIQNFVLTPENRKLMDARITTFGDLFLKRTRELILQNESPLTASHLLGETPVEYAELLDNKGEPIEYLCREDIPMSSVIKLGDVKLSDYKDLSVQDRVKNAYLKLFQCEC